MKYACATFSVIVMLVSPMAFAKGDAAAKVTENSNQLDARERNLPIHDGMKLASVSTKARYEKDRQIVTSVLNPDVVPQDQGEEPSGTAH